MSGKLKVQELRDALAKRGLDTAGTKPVLVARLDAAIAQDQEEANKTDGGKTSKKRADDKASADSNPSKRVKNDDTDEASVDEDIDRLTVAQLRSALDKRGLSTAGTKITLRSRLLEATKTVRDTDADNADHDGDAHDKEEKIVVLTQKGHAVLDHYLPDSVKLQYHVLEAENGIYDAMLNQTNVRDNNNKFYVIQVLESDAGNRYYVYNRWGRVGVKGQDKLFGPFSVKETAVAEFEAKFQDKTRNIWAERHTFTPFPNKYTWLERDYSADVPKASEANTNDGQNMEEKSKAIVKTPRQSKLDSRLESFISCICNISMMKQQMMEIGYDANKMPLGKLSKATILKGYESLKKIAAVLEGSAQGSLENLSSEFYTVIPHDFGFHRMRNFIIDTHAKLKRKLEMVEALGEIELATKLLQDGDADDDPAYIHYLQLKCSLEPLDHNDERFGWIKQYLTNTHAKTHGYYDLELLQVFEARRECEKERFQKFSQVKNRMLLWHGSRLTNWTGILSQGLRIAPPEAPSTGYMFGKGVYFADMVSKSANYCYTSAQDPIGVLLLCEVALGEMRELLHSDYNAGELPEGKLSTKGVGSTEPDPTELRILPDGVVVPLGKPVENSSRRGSLLYNEYIVYNVDQIQMRYVLQVKFNYRHRNKSLP